MIRSLVSTPLLGHFIDSLEKYEPKIKNEDEPKKIEELPDYRKTGLNSKEMQEAAKQVDSFLKFQAKFPSDSEIKERQKRLEATPQKLTKSLEHLKDYNFLSSTAKKIWNRLKIFKNDKKYEDVLKINEETMPQENTQLKNMRPFYRMPYGEMLKRHQGEETQKNMKTPGNSQRQEMIEQLTTLASINDNKKLDEAHNKTLEKMFSDQEQSELKEWQKSLGEENSKDQVKEQVSQLLQNNHMIKISEGKYTVTPNALRQIARKCLKEIFSDLEKGMIGRHETQKTSYNGLELKDSTKPYEFGDQLNLDLTETLRNAIRKSARLPIELDYNDFVIKETGHVTNSATVIAIDVSGSMNGLPLLAARKVTLALECLIEERFKGDYLGIIAFSEKAKMIPSYSIARMGNESSGATNFQEALLMSEKILAGKRALNKQIIIVSDMEPTTYNKEPPKRFLDQLATEIKKQKSIPRPKLTPNEEDKTLDDVTRKMLQELFGQMSGALEAYSNPSLSAALYEASRLSKQKIKVNFYMLGSHLSLDEVIPVYSKFTTGKIFMPKTDDLGKTLMYDFLKGRAKSIN
jgi:Mg-chelatase subunit ChlD